MGRGRDRGVRPGPPDNSFHRQQERALVGLLRLGWWGRRQLLLLRLTVRLEGKPGLSDQSFQAGKRTAAFLFVRSLNHYREWSGVTGILSTP
jgi:hypothetical protein